jgi:hypothetical protein
VNLQDIEKRLAQLESQVALNNDIIAIEKLQKKYGYCLDRGRKEDIINMFSDDAESIEVSDYGVFLGKKGVSKFFHGDGKPKAQTQGRLSLVLQIQGVVDVSPDGKTAEGRWTGFMIGTRNIKGVPTPSWGLGTYENKYIKENGEWKFKKLNWNIIYRTTFEEGWVKQPDIAHIPYEQHAIKGDLPPTAYHPYPSEYFVPFHWDNTSKTS